MSVPVIVSDVVWNLKAESETKELKTELEQCNVTVIEITTSGFTGTIDIQGKVHELANYSNIPYIRQDQAVTQFPSVTQLSYSGSGVYRYVILGWWRRFKIVMTRTAGTITLAVAGSTTGQVFPVAPSEIADIVASLVIIEQETYETETHVHNHEKWFGAAAVANGEIHVADRLGPGISPFALLSGNDDWGDWVQILGSDDTPIRTGMTLYDAHRFMVTTTNSTSPFNIQFVEGESADIAAKIAAEDMGETPYISSTNNADSGVADLVFEREATGTKLWARSICIGMTAKTLNLYLGIHEYVR
ncbi:hypothetical protein LCGC14_1977960 [marine sediment metagenome]|uniref:Uncharacterized protein n=1 Tax=marine sediment metagenome TaxID=412755 RepID=A0A0F9FXY7_9ZZZZ